MKIKKYTFLPVSDADFEEFCFFKAESKILYQ